MPGDDGGTSLYRWAVLLLIATSAAAMVGRIAVVNATTGETPMLSANDRSRWCTVRTLVEDNSYVIDRLVKIKHPETQRRYWKSIDMVRHRGLDGKEHYYSSKPTLLPTLLAGEYWVIRSLTGATLGDDPFLVMRLMIVITNVLPLLVYFLVLWRLIDHLTTNSMAAIYALAAATWGTFLTTFAVTINNHTVAAIAVLLATALMMHIALGAKGWWYFAGAGLCSAFAAANELPALSFFACVAIVVVWKSPRQTVLAFAPAALLVGAGFFGTNYLAHGTIVPAYAHRSDGAIIATVHRDVADLLDREVLPSPLRDALQGADVKLSQQAIVLVDQPEKRWVLWDRVGQKRFALVMSAAAQSDDTIEIRRWNNWYDYPGSYWKTNRQGVDRGEASRAVYALHVLVGHRGVFSLTPIWLLAAAGVVLLLKDHRTVWRLLAVMVVALSVVCLAFYISRPEIDRNYGGVCCGFRWMFWFTPLWLLCLVPAAERLLASKWGRGIALTLLVISVFSATYAAANPWSQPWLFELGVNAGWWQY